MKNFFQKFSFCIFIILFTFSFSAFSLNFMASFGQELKYEKDENSNLTERQLKAYSVGLGFDRLYYILDYSFFTVASGENSLIIDRKVESLMLWGQWYSDIKKYYLNPYLSVGLGGSQEVINTTLLGVLTSDRSRTHNTIGAAAGIKLDVPCLWVSSELRLIYSEKWDPNPSVAWFSRLGIYF
jgi:hypothetical protein